MRRLRLLFLGAVSIVFLGVLCFAGFGWWNGYAVHTALYYMLTPDRAPVEYNPPLHDITGHTVTWVADIADPELNESSGLTASGTHQDLLWSINDSGGGAFIYAVDLQGTTQARIEIDGATSIDWEALDSLVIGNQAYLLIGDIGDNFRWRGDLTIFLVEEPRLVSVSASGYQSAPLANQQVLRRYRLTLPDGPRDFEAMAYDARRQRILFVSKRVYPPEFYAAKFTPEIDLGLESGDTNSAKASPQGLVQETALELKRLAQLSTLPQPTERDYAMDSKFAKYRHMPTGMDVFADHVMVTTYKHAYLYDANHLERAPLRVTLPTVGQREAITFAHNRSDVVYLSRERVDGTGDAELFRVDLPSSQGPAAAVQDTMNGP